jgi:magnesium-transporting ATPase (P-type)
MTAAAVATPAAAYRVTGSGFDPAGTILNDGHPLAPEELKSLASLLEAAALCGNARVERLNGVWRAAGDPSEAALVVLAHKGGLAREAAERRAPRVKEFPFESARKRMSTVHALASGRFMVFAKGSPETLLDLCTYVRDGEVRAALDPSTKDLLARQADALADRGFRVMALARRLTEVMPGSAAEAECELELLGLVGLADPVRPEVPEAMASCRRAGIRVLIVTGDHPATAATVARRAGLPEGQVILGGDLPEEEEKLAALLGGPVSILARVAPEQKLQIARALQARGDVVAMTGDGVNDAPALRQADVGVAMGRSGTDVAREAADLILLDDNFAHIVQAIQQGRASFDNIRRFLTYHLTDNVAELAPFVIWALSAGVIPLVLRVLQVLALDIGTDLLPALALGAEEPEPKTMARPPRRRADRLLDRTVIARAFGFLGPLEAVLSLSMLPLGAAAFFAWRPGEALPAGGPALATLSTLVFASIVAMQMANAFVCRAAPPARLSRSRPFSNRLLVGAVAIEVVSLLAFVYLPPLAAVLGHRGLTLGQWMAVLASPVLFLAAEEGRRTVLRCLSRSTRGSRLD